MNSKPNRRHEDRFHLVLRRISRDASSRLLCLAFSVRRRPKRAGRGKGGRRSKVLQVARVRPAPHLRVLDLQPPRPRRAGRGPQRRRAATRAEAEHLLRERGRRAVREPASEAADVGKEPFARTSIASVLKTVEALNKKEIFKLFESLK